MGSIAEDLGVALDGCLGLSDDDIQRVAEDQSVGRLPGRYVEFLQVMGRKAGRLLAGTDAFYLDILGLKQEASDVLAENSVGDLIQDGSVVFAMHQGCQVYWLPGSALDDPPVFMYQEGDRGVSKVWGSFTEFLRYERARLS
ncbi:MULTISPECIES: SMI1/KNR4 family protein [Micromonospora]|uniref:SMI1 / KNR4 family (SUKH-1) n=1 Tax=Micromonospora yangpuensis TaxID=683228 RepID=A0A1C6UC11_9ACTN|nr:SMI1/KNR4 family protein [Micromonospora yangpuensis]GGM29598.1 hypothetical protein GCM10012279_55420 [Micromonospora yangpuensis]SCL51557.1 SMI1 / KNR4 family (SUKH-1) [Micromonospora yangpuensis]